MMMPRPGPARAAAMSQSTFATRAETALFIGFVGALGGSRASSVIARPVAHRHRLSPIASSRAYQHHRHGKIPPTSALGRPPGSPVVVIKSPSPFCCARSVLSKLGCQARSGPPTGSDQATGRWVSTRGGRGQGGSSSGQTVSCAPARRPGQARRLPGQGLVARAPPRARGPAC